MIETEQRLSRAAEMMAQRERHHALNSNRSGALARAAERGLELSGEQIAAFQRVTDGRRLGSVARSAGSAKATMPGVVPEARESAGLSVRGAALAGTRASGWATGHGKGPPPVARRPHQ